MPISTSISSVQEQKWILHGRHGFLLNDASLAQERFFPSVAVPEAHPVHFGMVHGEDGLTPGVGVGQIFVERAEQEVEQEQGERYGLHFGSAADVARRAARQEGAGHRVRAAHAAIGDHGAAGQVHMPRHRFGRQAAAAQHRDINHFGVVLAEDKAIFVPVPQDHHVAGGLVALPQHPQEVGRCSDPVGQHDAAERFQSGARQFHAPAGDVDEGDGQEGREELGVYGFPHSIPQVCYHFLVVPLDPAFSPMRACISRSTFTTSSTIWSIASCA